MELRIHSYELTLRLADAEQIEVRPVTDEDLESASKSEDFVTIREEPHPMIGEGKPNPSDEPLPKAAMLTYALIGNQNCGKTTLFNQLTGSNQHVGNFPGVTVDRKDGVIQGHPNTTITDLPGIYSFSPYTS
jgi:ferrous iron transport protein B